MSRLSGVADMSTIRHMDWGEGNYESMGKQLESVSERIAEQVAVAGSRVLDVGCGNGNAALALARRDANVTAIDPSSRLLSMARERFIEAELAADFVEGGAESLPFDTGSFDSAVSVFAMIFAPDPAAAASEIARVVRPGGRVVIATWLPEGAIAEVGKLLVEVLYELHPELKERPRPRWGERDFIEEMFRGKGSLTLERQRLPFRAESPEAWFADVEENHPVWRSAVRGVGSESARWRDVRRRSISLLHKENEDPDRFCVTSDYLVATLTRDA